MDFLAKHCILPQERISSLEAFVKRFLLITIEDLIAEGDQVVARLTARGTNTGDLRAPAPRPATGKHVTMTGIAIARLANGRFVEIWHQVDWLGMFQQLGLIPSMG